MENKFIELSQSNLIELNIDKDQQLNLFDANDSNLCTTINLHVAERVNLEINMTSLNYKDYKKSFIINIYIDGKESNITAKSNCLGLNKSQTNIEVNGICNQNINSKINIQINGIIDSPDATISGKPKFIFKTNSIEARHGLTIGRVNEHELIYLLSRGINSKTAKYMLISAKLFECLKNLSKNEYETKKQNILNIWGETNA